MPYLIILFSLFFAACKSKENAIGRHAVVSSSEQKSFITIVHNPGESLIRNKLLNLIVEETYPGKNPDFQIKPKEELIGYELSDRDMGIYHEHEKKMTKLVVSYSEHLEIYFIPRRVVISELVSQLGLKPEPGRIFKWLKFYTPSTSENTTLYLINVNYEDLMENDKNFYQLYYDLKDLGSKKELNVESYKEMELTMQYNFFKEVPVAQTFNGRKVICNRETRESGGCGQCSYSKLVASGKFERILVPSLDELGVKLKIDGREVLFGDLSSELVNQQEVKFRIRAEAFTTSPALKVEFFRVQPVSHTIDAGPANYTEACIGDEGRGLISLQRKSDIDLKVKVMGRGEALRKIVL